jgi:AcrR family transcriptional regulator
VARPLSQHRRNALLKAAMRVFADQGLSAPTALISKVARVSEGSLFTYFKTKGDLINELYRALRQDQAEAVMEDFPRRGALHDRLEHVWLRYVQWGVDNRIAKRALRAVSSVVSPTLRAESGTLFDGLGRLRDDKKLRIPPVMASATLQAMAEMTMDLIEREPQHAGRFKHAGFQMLWAALTVRD